MPAINQEQEQKTFASQRVTLKETLVSTIDLNHVVSMNNVSVMNSNFDIIEAAINGDVIHRAGGQNVMQQDLDMNGHALLNLSTNPSNPGSPLTVGSADARYYRQHNVPSPSFPGDAIPKSYVDALNLPQGFFTQLGTGAIQRTWTDKVRETSVSVTDFGAKGDGTTDDSAAIQAAFNSSALEIVFPTPPVYWKCKNLILPVGKKIRGLGRVFTYNPTTLSTMNGTNCLVFDTTGTWLINYQGQNSVEDLNFHGVNKTVYGLGQNSTLSRIFMRNVGMHGFAIGFGTGTSGGSSYTRGAQLYNCNASQNTYGIRNLIDSQVHGGQVNANDLVGISGQAGANDVSYIGIKCEWNGTANYDFFQCNSIVIAGGICDRAGTNGFNLGQSNVTITGTKVRRSGRSGSVGSGTAHFRLSSNTSVVIAGVTTGIGADDDGSGFTSPDYIFNTASSDSGPVTIVGSDMLGSNIGTNINAGFKGYFSGNTGKVNVNYPLVSNTVTISPTLAATTTANSARDIIPLGTNTNLTNRYRVFVSYRNASTGSVATNEFSLRVTRGGSGNAAATLYGAVDATSTAINLTGATLNMTVANVAADGSSFDIVATNTNASQSLQAIVTVRSE